MSMIMNNQTGDVTISDNVLKSIVGYSVNNSYGVVGMCASDFKEGITQFLKKENYGKGIVVKTENNELSVDVYIVVNYGTKIPEIAKTIQDEVIYSVKSLLDIDIHNVNIYIEGIVIADKKDEDKKDKK